MSRVSESTGLDYTFQALLSSTLLPGMMSQTSAFSLCGCVTLVCWDCAVVTSCMNLQVSDYIATSTYFSAGWDYSVVTSCMNLQVSDYIATSRISLQAGTILLLRHA